jgi:hypothetical protein
VTSAALSGNPLLRSTVFLFIYLFISPEISKNIKSIAKGVKDFFGNKCAKAARHI